MKRLRERLKGLGRMIGLKDGKTAKKYAKKYAPYLLRNDEAGYII